MTPTDAAEIVEFLKQDPKRRNMSPIEATAKGVWLEPSDIAPTDQHPSFEVALIELRQVNARLGWQAAGRHTYSTPEITAAVRAIRLTLNGTDQQITFAFRDAYTEATTRPEHLATVTAIAPGAIPAQLETGDLDAAPHPAVLRRLEIGGD